MAAGFKQATVNASHVPSTQTNFPASVDLSRIGITTLAEAESVRVYSDAAKTVELARQIVSVDEMHVKIPSLTSSFVLYVDWDGVRSDYANSATYGRNEVWSDYVMVLHLEEDPSGGAPQMIDSTGNGHDATSNGSMTAGDSVAGAIGQGLHLDTSNDFLDIDNDAVWAFSGDFTVQSWIQNNDSASGDIPLLYRAVSTGWSIPYYAFMLVLEYRTSGSSWLRFGRTNTSNGRATANHELTSFASDTWYFAHGVYSGTTLKAYVDGVKGADATNTGSIKTTTQNTRFGAIQEVGGYYFESKHDEVRARASALSDDWIETEVNNQSNESGFWGAWSDVPSGSTTISREDVEMWLDMADGSGATVTDESGNGHDAVLSGGYSWGTAGVPSGLNGFVEFNGSNAIGTVAHADSLNPGLDPFSIGVWMYSDNVNLRQGGIWKGNTAGDWYMLAMGGSGFSNNAEFLTDDGSDFDPCRGGALNTNGTWYMILGVRTATGLIVYVNGVQVASVTDTNGDISPSDALEIGFADPDNAWLDGRIAQAIYLNRDLTADEASELYAGGAGMLYSDLPVATPQNSAFLAVL